MINQDRQLMSWTGTRTIYTAGRWFNHYHKDLRFTDITIENVLETSDEAEEGSEVECDLHMPVHLHDKLREFPPVPENLTPDIACVSDFQKNWALSSR